MQKIKVTVILSFIILLSGCEKNDMDTIGLPNKSDEITLEKISYSNGYDEGFNAPLNKNWKNEGIAVKGSDGFTHVSTKGDMMSMCKATLNSEMTRASVDQHHGKKIVFESEESIFQACIDGYSDGLDRKNKNTDFYITKSVRNKYYGIDSSTPQNIFDEPNNVK